MPKTTITQPLIAVEFSDLIVEKALDGSLCWQKNVLNSLNQAINKIDDKINQQLNLILHHPLLQKLEGSWRGLHYLVTQAPSQPNVKHKLLHCSKHELFQDADQAIEFDQSQLFKKIYETEFGTAGGEPYAAIIGDFEFDHQADDLTLLNHISQVSAASFAPFISAASPQIFGLTRWSELGKPRDLHKIIASRAHYQWQQFCQTTESRFVCLTLPRVLARNAYQGHLDQRGGFTAKEYVTDNEDACWSNAAYFLAARLTDAQTEHGWCTAIRGTEGGGKVNKLPQIPNLCPTETTITDRREAELSDLGFLPLCHYKNTDYAVFFGGETCHQPPRFDNDAATANAAISARLPYLMATSRFAHYLKIMARDKIGSHMQLDEISEWLNRWIIQYVNSNASTRQNLKAKYPLAEAQVAISEIPNKPGHYHAIAWLKPWLQLEQLTTSLRLVATIPARQR